MSVLECPDVQIWNNLAYDNGESEQYFSESFQSDSSKENQYPEMIKSAASVNSPAVPIKPLRPKNCFENSQSKPNKIGSKNEVGKYGNEEGCRDESKIDSEIRETEMEIRRLSLRLESLRVEKLKMNKAKTRKLGFLKNIEEPLSLSNGKVQRRGVTMGPSEIMAGSKRFLQLGKLENTPVSIQNRRKSCFWKPNEIDELKVTKERGGGKSCSSLSPKPRITGSKIQPLNHALTTIGSKKFAKKDDGFISKIQPMKLFEGEKSTKKSVKAGRVVASRYMCSGNTNLSGEFSALRKRSLPDDGDKDDVKRIEKKRASLAGKRPDLCVFQGMESRVKKRWEIPSEIVVCKGTTCATNNNNNDGNGNGNGNDVILPKIRTVKCVNETPRDSGAAKRVSELVGKKSYFGDGEASFCQALSFTEEE